MADAIRFRCKNCEKKITVKPEYAGKKAKCPGCQQPIRVPTPAGKPKPRPAKAEPDFQLSDLAALEANAEVELKELSAKAARRPMGPRIEGGKDCPGCGSSCKPDAVLCVHCGHNFESGKRLKTKKSREKQPRQRGGSSSYTATEEQTWGLRGLYLLYALVFFVLGIAVFVAALRRSSMTEKELESFAQGNNFIMSLPGPVIALAGLAFIFSGVSLAWIGIHAQIDFSKKFIRVMCVAGGLPLAMAGGAMLVLPCLELAGGAAFEFRLIKPLLFGFFIMPAGVKMLINGLRGGTL